MSGPCVPVLSVGDLVALAKLLTERLQLERGEPPCVLRVRHVGDDEQGEVEVGMLGLAPGDHPLDGLVDLRAEDDWVAVGAAATGRLRPLDGGGDDEPEPVRTTHLVGRDGSWATRWQPLAGGGSIDLHGSADDPGAPEGRVDDACRLCLGLTTAQPTVGTDVLWATMWLDAVLDRAATTAGRRRLHRWQAVAELHPAVQALVADPSGPLAPATVAGLATTLAELRSWSELRRAVSTGTLTVRDVDAATAAWLDDGAFSRWALGAYPDLPELADAVDAVLPPPVAAAVRATLAALRR